MKNNLSCDKGWPEYLKGVAYVLQRAGYILKGWKGVLAGNIPISSGLSSSAALEMALMKTFSVCSGFPWDARAAALLAKRAENDWIGVACGIMDQLVSSCGEEGHALLIDCRTLERKSIPLSGAGRVVIVNPHVQRNLVDSPFNARKRQCETAASILGVSSLRDVSVQQLMAFQYKFAKDETAFRRALHVVSENDRTLRAVDALSRHDLVAFGKILNESHASLKVSFEVSTSELDTIVSIAQQHPACFGARLTGAGFGGCIVAVVDCDQVGEFCMYITSEYESKKGVSPSVYVCSATNGTTSFPGSQYC